MSCPVVLPLLCLCTVRSIYVVLTIRSAYHPQRFHAAVPRSEISPNRCPITCNDEAALVEDGVDAEALLGLLVEALLIVAVGELALLIALDA